VKYVLVDSRDKLVHTVDLASNVGLSGARTYFLGVKKLDIKEFDKLWKVMTKPEYDRQSHPGYIKWWKDERTNPDMEKD